MKNMIKILLGSFIACLLVFSGVALALNDSDGSDFIKVTVNIHNNTLTDLRFGFDTVFGAFVSQDGGLMQYANSVIESGQTASFEMSPSENYATVALYPISSQGEEVSIDQTIGIANFSLDKLICNSFMSEQSYDTLFEPRVNYCGEGYSCQAVVTGVNEITLTVSAKAVEETPILPETDENKVDNVVVE